MFNKKLAGFEFLCGESRLDNRWKLRILPPFSNKCTLGHVLTQTLLFFTNSLDKSSYIYDTKLIPLDSYWHVL
jgi:hypothetical protein